MAYDDLRDDIVGHVGAQCHIDGEDYNGGVSISNSRLWVIKSFPIDGYVDFISDVLRQMGAGQPGQIRRLAARFEQTLVSWPSAIDPIAVALDSFFMTDVNDVHGLHPADVDVVAHVPDGTALPLEITTIGWRANLRTSGAVETVSSDFVVETKSGEATFAELLVEYPPTIYFRDGTATRGQRLVPPGSRNAAPPLGEILDTSWDWAGTNIQHETPRDGRTDTIHAKVEDTIAPTHPNAWLIGDDGSGEIADHIVIEPMDDDHLHLHLYHSKASTEATPGLRTRDLDELVAQIVRSKRWIALADRRFWEQLAVRIRNRQSTRVLASPSGESAASLADACRGWSDRPPIITTHYVGFNPDSTHRGFLATITPTPAGTRA